MEKYTVTIVMVQCLIILIRVEDPMDLYSGNLMKSVKKDTKPHQDQPDFYWENGLMVFTETFHRKRGYCCQSGCRHCPYGFDRKAKDQRNANG
jgi:Family of unknown function (DUF5522)